MPHFEIKSKELIKDVHEWAAANKDRFKYLWPLRGGWEPWFQVEIAAFLIRKYPDLRIEREVSYPQPFGQLRADLVINEPDGVSDQIWIELKCQRSTDLKGHTLAEELMDDCLKLAVSPDGPNAVIGIFYSEQAEDAIKKTFQGLKNLNFHIENHEVGIFTHSWNVLEN